MDIKYDCHHFKGYMPCTPNKTQNYTCDNCPAYLPVSKKILIIKLGAIGDVIRTTPLIEKYNQLYPNCQITWVTLFPDVLPKESIHSILKLNAVSVLILKNEDFDIAINLDKDKEACILLDEVDAEKKYGFIWNDKHIDIATPAAKHKLMTGLFDGLSKANTKSYLEEIFEICHLEFNHEEYLIRTNEVLVDKWDRILGGKSRDKKIVGLNTGCGPRWKTRLWPEANWIGLINKLEKEGYYCVVLGGEQEHYINQMYAEETGAYYPGHFSLEEFISLSNNCDIIVTQVSMMMHIAMALKKQLILFNNIFNQHEFEMYNRGVIIEPTSGCDCFYGNTCSRDKSCMYDIKVDSVVEEVKKLKIS